MVVVPMKETKLVVAMDDLDFRIKNVAFEAKVFGKYGTFDQIANRNMENPGYPYFHCDLLDMVTLTTIILKLKSPYIKMHEQHLQKRWNFFALSQSLKKVLRKVTCMLSSQLS